MDAFIVELKNQPGTFGRLADAIAARGVNMMCAGAAFADFGIATFYADDSTGLRAALDEAGADYRAVPTFKVQLDNRPGTAAEIARLLSDDGINLDLFMPIEITAGRCVVAIGCEDSQRAALLFSDRIVS
jgi:hypothetical protein